jgi:regulator of sirC expression with transglutaminase-like and TPR domain
MRELVTRRQLRSVLDRDDREIDLGYAALLIAQEEYPDLRVAEYLGRIDELAARVQARRIPTTRPRRLAEAINLVLFDQEGFSGNQNSYYDPRNSFLNEVLDRKLGIPITLSILYLEVGRRVGLRLAGIGLPGHFIVGIGDEAGPDAPVLIDPYYQGQFLDEAECARRLEAVYRGQLRFQTSMLAPFTARQILGRLLMNLKAIYAKEGDYGRALGVVERLLLINPDSPQELRDRGAIYQRMRFYGQAVADLTRYLDRAPRAPDADTVREAVQTMRRAILASN